MSYTETEEKIFRAAVEVFSACGKDGARMQMIADTAGINKALVHYYFRSKEKLYDQAFEFIVRNYIAQIGMALREKDDFSSLLKEVIDRYCDLLDANPMIYKFMFREVLNGAPEMKARFKVLMEDAGGNPIETFMQKLKEAIRRKEIRAVDPMQTFITLMGSLVFYYISFPLLSTFRPDMENDKQKFTKARKKHVYEILYNGLKLRKEGE